MQIDDWRTKAACRGADISIFYPHYVSAETMLRAATFCSTCPVVNQCRTYASSLLRQSWDGYHGIWGGMAKAELAAWARERGLL